MWQVAIDHVDARPQAIARIAVALAALITAGENLVLLSEIVESGLFIPVLPTAPPPTEAASAVLSMSMMVAAVALGLGFQSKWAARAVASAAMLVLLIDQQMYSNHQLLLFLLSLYLGFGEPGARWSLDARIKNTQRTYAPYWPQLLMMTQLTALYIFTALAKINPIFLDGEMLEAVMWTQMPEIVLVTLSAAAICLELFIPIGLWVAPLRKAAMIGGVALHATIVVALDQPLVLFAFALLCLGCYPMFFRFQQIKQADRT